MTDPQVYVRLALWSQVISAVVFIGFLVWLWAKYIQPAIMAAQDRFNKQIAEAERHRDEARAMLELLHGELSGAERDAELIRERAKVQAEREYDATVTEARETGERSLQGARGELERARAAARSQLRVELLENALSRARGEASQRVDATTNARLVDNFVGALDPSTSSGQGNKG